MDATGGDDVLHVNQRLYSPSQRGYDQLAPAYRSLERLAFGSQLQRARIALIDELPPWNRLLIFGDGDGRLLEQICIRRLGSRSPSFQRDFDFKITSVDQSLVMLDRQRSRIRTLEACDHVEFMHIDACTYQPKLNEYDVLVMPFFLDCFSKDDLETYLPNWLAALRNQGLLYYVDFVVPKSHWQRPRAALFLWAMHLFFGWQTGLANRKLVDMRPWFERYSLRKMNERINGHGMIATQLWQKRRESTGN